MEGTIPYPPISSQERRDVERRAGKPLPTDEEVEQFLVEEREYAMREELFGGRRKHLEASRIIEDRRLLALAREDKK